MRKFLSAAMAALAVVSVCAQAQNTPNLEGFWSVQFAPGPEAEALREKLPPDAVFINDAGGLELGEGEYAGLVLSDAAKQEITNYDFSNELSAEFACTQPSVVLYMQAPFPFELYQDSKLIVLRMEYFDMTRVIFMDGREHPPVDAPHSKNGHSVGHWDDGDLVVDTTHVLSGTFMNNGFSHSDDIHMVERFRLSADGKTLTATQVSDDPAVFQGKAARLMSWRKADDYVYPYECDPSFGELGE